jgi:hypothetical protein
MKTITKNLWLFILITTIASLIFFYFLYNAIDAEHYNLIFIYCPVFSIVLFFSGFLLGKNDSLRKTRNDLGFSYHLANYIIVNIINAIWVFGRYGTNRQQVIMVVSQILIWGIFLLAHYYFSRKSLKGYPKKSIF